MKNTPDEKTAITDIPQSCFDKASASLKSIACYEIPEPRFEDPRIVKWRADKVVTDTYRYVIMDGKYYEQCDTYERGISYRYIGDTENDMTAHLLYEEIWRFAIEKAAANGLYGDDGANEAALITEKCFAQLPDEYHPYYIRRKA